MNQKEQFTAMLKSADVKFSEQDTGDDSSVETRQHLPSEDSNFVAVTYFFGADGNLTSFAAETFGCESCLDEDTDPDDDDHLWEE